MPTQSQVQNTILTGMLKCADLSNTNRVNSISGVGRVSWKLIRKITLFISAVSRQYVLGDFSSNNFLSCYACLCKLVGAYGNGDIDPNAHATGIIIDVTIITEDMVVVQIPFSGQTGLSINWQTDIPDGYGGKTYAQLLSNYFINPVVWFNSGVYIEGGSTPAIDYDDVTNMINTVTFNWGSIQSGYLRF